MMVMMVMTVAVAVTAVGSALRCRHGHEGG